MHPVDNFGTVIGEFDSLWNFSIVGCQWTVNSLLGGKGSTINHRGGGVVQNEEKKFVRRVAEKKKFRPRGLRKKKITIGQFKCKKKIFFAFFL